MLVRVRRFSSVVLATAMLIGCVAGVEAPARAMTYKQCTPGVNGCVPNPDQCATGQYNHAYDGGGELPNTNDSMGPFGRFAFCDGGGGHVNFYYGGSVFPACGQVVIDGTEYTPDDPNTCGAAWPPNYTLMHQQVDTGNKDRETQKEIYLDGWIVLPPLAGKKWTPSSGVRFPMVLDALPYFGQQFGESGSYPHSILVDRDLLLDHGYGLALFSVRGTGNSSGCFEWGGPEEQKDMVSLVNWLGDKQARPWSNGKVAMAGGSYGAGTAWETAIKNPPALKAIVAASGYTDHYTGYHSPQGLSELYGVDPDPTSDGFIDYPIHQGLLPPVPGEYWNPQYWLVDHAPVAADRMCKDVLKHVAYLHAGGLQEHRDGPFWDERNLIKDFGQIHVPALFTYGFEDPGIFWSDDNIWESLTHAPKKMIEGQWKHEWPTDELPNWNAQMISWLDGFMKGNGVSDANTVQYEDGAKNWHTTSSWPPADSHDEVMYMSGSSLQAKPGSGTRSFLAAENARNIAYGDATHGDEDFHHLVSALCPLAGDMTDGLLYETAPLSKDVTLAGNPFAYLNIKSSMVGGQLSVALIDERPDFQCVGGVPSDAAGDIPSDAAKEIALGGADLRFSHGNYDGEDFTSNRLRVDLWSLAKVVPAGHKLAVVIGYGGDDTPRYGQPYTPIITISGNDGIEASQVVLPLTSGTLGGLAPTLTYPPRPFIPTSQPAMRSNPSCAIVWAERTAKSR